MKTQDEVLLEHNKILQKDRENRITLYSNIVDSFQSLTTTLGNYNLDMRIIDYEFNKLDIKFNLFSKKLDHDLIKYIEGSRLIEDQLNHFNRMANVLFDQAMACSPQNEVEMDLQLHLLDKVTYYIDKITELSLKLL